LNAVLSWNRAALEAVRRTGMGPPIAARALHVLHACMYDAWAAHDDLAFGSRLGDLVRRPPADRTEGAKREAASFAAHRALVDLFPSEAAAFAKLMGELGYDPDAVGPQGSPSAVGVLAARVVLAFRHGDEANQLGDLGPEPRGLAGAYGDWTGYRPVNELMRLVDPNRWQPLPTPDGAGQRFLVPHWRLVVPFALRAGWELRPRGPRRHPGPGFLAQAVELLANSAGLDDETKAIAEYWADGPGTETPPGHWCLLAQEVSARDDHGLDEDVRLFFALTAALHDAAIACWDAKRAYDSVRPVTAIRFLFAGLEVLAWGGPGQGTRPVRGEDWQPYLATPPFPEHPSGHSTFSAAAAAVLARFTGSDRFGASVTIPAGSSRVEPGTTPAADVVLAWPTFTAAADQAGRSRRHGGIHFKTGDLVGRALGAMVGARTWQAAVELFAGPPRGCRRAA
jgi:membrane-associated phospholipid phosphatase